LLLDTDMPLKQIAENVGFANVFYFSRMFRRFFRDTPAACRKRHAQSTSSPELASGPQTV
jgi:AraC-like DNA-binding protein